MKKIRTIFLPFILYVAVVASFFSCIKNENGNVIFYSTNSASTGIYPIKITINAVQGIEYWEDSIATPAYVTPDCGSNNGVTLVLRPGAYNYSATSANNTSTWNGTVNITTNGCFVKSLQ